MEAEQWNQRYATKEFVWSVEPNRFVAEHLGELDPGTAIDLGAGEGRNAVWLATRGWSATAVDFSDVAADKGRRLAERHGVTVDFVVADATVWQPDGDLAGGVDLVLLSYLQLPEEQRRTALEHAASWVGPGGLVFVIAHDRSNVEHGHGGPPSEAVCYTVDETVDALDGLSIEVARVAERPVETDDGTKIALDTLVIARRTS